MNVVIVGGGISGLTLALTLNAKGIPCRVYEEAPEFKPLGVGISLQANGVRRLDELGLVPALSEKGVPAERMAFFNRFGQNIWFDQTIGGSMFLVHRADLHEVLVEAVHDRLGPDAIVFGQRCVSVEQDDDSATVHFVDATGAPSIHAAGDVAIACDGIRSTIREQLYPDEGEPVWSGVNLWRGITVRPAFLGGQTHTIIGELDTGKMVVYPIRDDVDGAGNQLVNWVAELREPTAAPVAWNVPIEAEAVAAHFEGWNFDWLDVEEMVRAGDPVFQYPMSDRDPVDHWAFGRVLLIGDAAHPMLPRAGNGAMQGIIDAAVLAEYLAENEDPQDALAAFEADRLPRVNDVVRAARATPPDVLMELVRDRVGDAPFDRREDIVTDEEIEEVLRKFRAVTAEKA